MLGAPVVAVLVDDLSQLVADDLPLPLGRGQDVLVVGDLRHQLVMLVDELLPLQRGQPAQLHVEDGPGLHLVDLQQLHQALLGGVADSLRPDQRDHLVDPVDAP